MSNPKPTQLKATPELEDFGRKYTEDGEGKIGRKLLDGYFQSVEALVAESGINRKRTAKAIEIGCGEGFSTQRLRDILPDKIQLQASEYVADLVPKARKRNPGVKITQESAYETKHANNTYDMIFLLEVLEHLDYPDQALAELRRILKPGGFLVLGVPREPLWCALNMARGKYLTHLGNTPGHLNHWSTLTLKYYVRKHFGSVVASHTPLPWTQVLLQKPS